MLWRSALRADSTAMLGPRSRRRTHCVRCALSVRTTAPSQSTKRASRADPGPALLVATEIAPTGHRPPRGPSCAFSRKKHQRVRKGAFGQIAARLWGAEKHRARGPARSANRQLTRRSCLSAVSAANEASSATGPRARASQGSRRKAPTAPVKRCGLPGRAFAAPTCARKANVQGRQGAECRRPLKEAVRIHAQRGFSKNTYWLKSLTSKYTRFSPLSTMPFRFSSSTP